MVGRPNLLFSVAVLGQQIAVGLIYSNFELMRSHNLNVTDLGMDDAFSHIV